MINFDLPWNPMRVEQRIGRVHRLGQQHDVRIYNLCTLGTIEEHIVSLLHEKINLFELVIGELDLILERFEKQELSIEQQIARLVAEAGDGSDLQRKMSGLGDSLSRIRDEVQSDTILEEDDALSGLLDAVGQTISMEASQ
jgi:hypothetical protein